MCSCLVCRIRIDIDLILTSKNTCEGVTSVINVQVCIECRGVIKYTSHGQCGSNVCGTQNHVALSSTSSLCDCVRISLDLENKTFELLNRPTTVGVNVKVESTGSSNVCLSTGFSNLIDGSDNFSIDFRKDFSREDVGKFCLGIQTVDCLEVLCQFQRILCFQSTGLSSNGDFLNRECHLVEIDSTTVSKSFGVCRGHTLTDIISGLGLSSWAQKSWISATLISSGS